MCTTEDRRSHQGKRKEVQHLLDQAPWPPRPAPPSPPQGLQACERPWYSSYAVTLGQEPSLKSTSRGVGRCKGRPKPGPSPGSADVRATRARYCAILDESGLRCFPENVSRPFEIMCIHTSREKGRAGHWTATLQRSPESILRAGWCPALPLTERLLSLQQRVLFIARGRLLGRGFSSPRGCLSGDCRFLRKARECQSEFMGRGAVNRGAPRPGGP